MANDAEVVRAGTSVKVGHGPFLDDHPRAGVGRWGRGIHHDRHGIGVSESCSVRYVENHMIEPRGHENMCRCNSVQGDVGGAIVECPCVVHDAHIVHACAPVEVRRPSFFDDEILTGMSRWGCGIHHHRHGIGVPEVGGIRNG